MKFQIIVDVDDEGEIEVRVSVDDASKEIDLEELRKSLEIAAEYIKDQQDNNNDGFFYEIKED